MDLKEILAKLNKGRDKVDQYTLASEKPADFYKTKVISTGSPYMDFKISQNIEKGGVPIGRFILIIGGESSGKTSLSLKTAANLQKESGKHIVIFDGEGTIDDSYFERFGIDKTKLIHHRGKNLEEFLDAAELLSKSDEVCAIIIDSLPAFFSTAVELKSAEDNTIGIEAKKFNARMPIIYGNCNNRNITMLVLNYYKMNPGAMGADPRTLSRGEWQRYYSSLTIELGKGDLIKEDGKIVGHKLRFRIKKSKVDAYDSKAPYEVNFYYDRGFDVVADYTDIMIEICVIRKSGAWFYLPSEEKFQGRDKTIQFLKDNPEYLEKLWATKEEYIPLTIESDD